jgi:hypothetical protein
MRAGDIRTVKDVRKSKAEWVGCFGNRLIITGQDDIYDLPDVLHGDVISFSRLRHIYSGIRRVSD